MSHVTGFVLFVVLLLVTAVAAPLSLGRHFELASSPQTGSASAWELGVYRETRLGAAPGMRRTAPLKLDSVAVVRPQLAPGERAALVAQYSVALPAAIEVKAIEVKETRIVRFNETVLLTREKVVTRAAGQWRSEYLLTVPRGAVEGLYTLTTKIEPLQSAQGGVDEMKAVFAVTSAASPTVAAPAPAAPVRPPAPETPPPAAAAPSPPAPAPTGGAPPPPAATPQPSGAASGIRISLWTDKQRYRVGETVTFHFETTRDAYVALINAGTSGAVTILFPNRFSQGHEVKGKTVYSIPRSQDGYTMNVTGPPGIELVYALATLEPIKFAESDFSGTRSIFRSVDGGAVTRDINAVAKQTRIDRQAKATIELEVVQ